MAKQKTNFSFSDTDSAVYLHSPYQRDIEEGYTLGSWLSEVDAGDFIDMWISSGAKSVSAPSLFTIRLFLFCSRPFAENPSFCFSVHVHDVS